MEMEGRHQRSPLLEMTNTSRAPPALLRYKKMNIILRFQYGGQFEITGDRLFYKKGSVYSKDDVDPDMLSYLDLEDYLKGEAGVENIKELWYLEAGKTINNGLKQLLVDNDILAMVNSVGGDRIAHVFAVTDIELSPSKAQASHNQSFQNDIGDGIVECSDSSSSDSDFSFKDSEDEDDDIFAKFVDNDIDDGLSRIIVQELEDAIDIDVVLSDDLDVDFNADSQSLRSGSDLDSRRKPRYPEFNPHVDS